MAYNTNPINEEMRVRNKHKIDRELLEEVREQLEASEDPEIQQLKEKIFETPEGQKIIEEFFRRKSKKYFKLTNF